MKHSILFLVLIFFANTTEHSYNVVNIMHVPENSKSIDMANTVSNIKLMYTGIDTSNIYNAVLFAYKYSDKYNIPPNIVLAICLRESRLNPNVNDTEACGRGICQMTKLRAKYLNLDYSRLNEMEYGIMACALNIYDIIYNLNIEQLCGIVAKYGNYSRKYIKYENVKNKGYFIDFMEHYDNLMK